MCTPKFRVCIIFRERGPVLCEAPVLMARLRPPSLTDPLAAAFTAAQQAYKAGLIGYVNARRQARELAPVEWPRVGTTPADELWHDGGARLVRYRGLRKGPAVLLVASLINRPYILDLLAGRSVVQRLLDGGLDVF